MEFSKKSWERINWLKKEMDKGVPKAILKTKFLDKYKVHFTNFYDLYTFVTTGDLSGRMKASQRKGTKPNLKRHIGDKDVCFFNGKGLLENHHISYCPEITVTLSETNHHKFHCLIKTYHEQIIKKDQELIKMNRQLESIKKTIN